MARNLKDNVKATLLSALLAGLALGTIGCNQDGTGSSDFFKPDQESSVKAIADAEAATGARADASIYPHHFDGGALNSLGQAKLDLLTANLPDEGPVTIYIDVPADGPLAKARMDAVAAYLVDSHLTADQFKLVAGPNLNMHYPTANALANMSKTDTGSGGDAGGGSSASGAAAASTSK